MVHLSLSSPSQSSHGFGHSKLRLPIGSFEVRGEGFLGCIELRAWVAGVSTSGGCRSGGRGREKACFW